MCEYNCTGECGSEFDEVETDDWLEELRERLGLEQEDPIFCRYGVPRSQLKAARRNWIKSGKVKAAGAAVASNIESVQSTVEKEVKETEEPGGAKVKVDNAERDEVGTKRKSRGPKSNAESSQSRRTEVQPPVGEEGEVHPARNLGVKSRLYWILSCLY